MSRIIHQKYEFYEICGSDKGRVRTGVSGGESQDERCMDLWHGHLALNAKMGEMPVPRITPFYFRKEMISLHRDGSGLYIVELREILVQIGIALRLDQTLVRPGSIGWALAVFGIEGIHDFHALNNLAKRREAA